MAGIGFRLQKILRGDSYTDLVRGYLYSSIISSGPMLVIIISLVVMKSAIQVRLGYEEGTLFMGLVIYAYAYSMLAAGPFFYVVTRYLADQYYLKKFDVFAPTYVAIIEILFVIQSILAYFYLSRLAISPTITLTIQLLSYLLFLFVGGIWIAMIFLSAARDYHWIVFGFLGGAILGACLALFLGNREGFVGYVAGFSIGQGVVFIILSIRIFIEFGNRRFAGHRDYLFLRYFFQHPYLVMIGLFYYLGTWIDKFVFWYRSTGDQIVPYLKVCFDYDTPLFFAFLTTVPSMAFFLIQMETSFVVHYQAYYKGIQQRLSFGDIKKLKDEMLTNLTQNLQKFVVFQGLLSGATIIFIVDIAEYFHLSPSQLGIFRIGILGAFLHVGLLFIMTIFFYFDFQREVWMISLIFLVSNFSFSILSQSLGLPMYGFGYAAATFLSVAIGIFVLEHKLSLLEYWTFMRQPVTLPQFKFESEKK